MKKKNECEINYEISCIQVPQNSVTTTHLVYGLIVKILFLFKEAIHLMDILYVNCCMTWQKHFYYKTEHGAVGLLQFIHVLSETIHGYLRWLIQQNTK